MSKVLVDAKEAAALVQRLIGGKLEFKERGFQVELPSLDVKCDVRRVVLEAVVQKGPIAVDLKGIEFAEQGITVDFSII